MLKNLHITTVGLLKLPCALLLIPLSFTSSAESHEKVHAALDWQMPLNNCKKPKPLRDQLANRSQAGVIGHGAVTNTTIDDSGGAPTVFDVDHYKIDRYNRKKENWEICVSNYKSELLEQFEVLKSSAQYGLTKRQAETIVGKLAQIQAAVISPDGIARTE
jgi:hypothetical protein